MNSTIFRRRKHQVPATPLTSWKFYSYENRNRNKIQVPSSVAGSGGTVVGRGGLRRRKGGGGGGKVEVSTRKLAAGIWRLWLAAGVLEGPAFGDGGGGKVEVSTRKLAARIWRLWLAAGVLEGPAFGAGGLSFKCGACNSFEAETKLMKAQLRIYKLETENQLFQKKIKHLVRKLEEERISRKRKEYQKILAVIYDLKNELNRERKNHQRMEILNSKLVNELAEVKLSAKQLRKDYEENKRGRKLMEEICNVLANKIADDKVKAEALRIESIKMWEEMEEERKMFQIAECWREECSQMKLIEAKLVLEDKYCQMNKLIAELEAFLRSGSCNLGVIELREVEFIRQAAKSINIKEIKEFSYVPSKSNDIYSIFQEVQQIETNERIAEICRTGVSKILNYSNGSIYSNSHFEEEAGDWESVWYSLEDSDPSVNVPSHWQSARESEQSVEKIPPIDNGNRKFINDIICRQKPTSLKRKYCERRPKLLNSAGQWSSNNSVNPHIIQGIKGCTEWPKHNQKNSFKAKLES